MVPVTLKDIRRRKAKRRRELAAALRSVRVQLREMGALKIVVFGSFARNLVRSDSDLDLISIMPATVSGRQWMRRIYAEVERGADCDILAYTPEELEATLPASRFLRHALKTGRVIYERRSGA
ncbi:MAG: nucleotidyltransferase domain-containing protein [bacterium]